MQFAGGRIPQQERNNNEIEGREKKRKKENNQLERDDMMMPSVSLEWTNQKKIKERKYPKFNDEQFRPAWCCCFRYRFYINIAINNKKKKMMMMIIMTVMMMMRMMMMTVTIRLLFISDSRLPRVSSFRMKRPARRTVQQTFSFCFSFYLFILGGIFLFVLWLLFLSSPVGPTLWTLSRIETALAVAVVVAVAVATLDMQSGSHRKWCSVVEARAAREYNKKIIILPEKRK